MADLGDLEAAVMRLLWDQDGPVSVRHVLEQLSRDRKIAYTTVMTVMDRLYKKGHLTRQADGKAFLYRAAASRAGYTAAVMAGALEDSGDRAAALVHFTEHISPDDAAALRNALRRSGRR